MMSVWKMLTLGCLSIHLSAEWDGGMETKWDTFAMKAQTIELPHQVFIRLNNTIGFCGGAIIGKSYVLTVASCLFDERRRLIDKSEIKVYVGGSEYIDFNIMHSVCDIDIHEDFSKSGAVDEYLVGNIAILTLVEELEFGEMVKPIKLPNEPLGNSEIMTAVSGFYTIDRARMIPFYRLHFPQMTMSRKDCSKFWKENSPDHINIGEDQLCARSILGPSTCYGDNGNAMVTIGQKEKVLIGLSTFSDRCGKDNSPDVYIRVWNYLSWIRKRTVMCGV